MKQQPIRSSHRAADLRRVTRRIERYCRQRVPDCRVVALVDGDRTAVDLRLGPAGAGREEQMWVRSIDPSALASDEAVDRLARLLRVWIEPQPSVPRGAERRGSGALSARP